MNIIEHNKNGLVYLTADGFEAAGGVAHGFSTRLGGASKGRFATMNFSYSRKDDPADVLENFTRLADALGVERDRMVVSYQPWRFLIFPSTMIPSSITMRRQRF